MMKRGSLELSTFPNQTGKPIIDCESLEEKECLKNQYNCGLCGEEITSNYISCHSTEFCENAAKLMY